jgi:ferredoxin
MIYEHAELNVRPGAGPGLEADFAAASRLLLEVPGCRSRSKDERGVLAMIEVKVDFARCDANGTCAALMPDVFQIGPDGLLQQLLTEVGEDRDSELEEVILCCPMGAISRA